MSAISSPTKDILLMGVQGCGKGTQGKLLKQEFDMDSFAMGDVLRDLQNSDRTEDRALYARVSAYMSQGELVPNHVVKEIVFGFMADRNSDGPMSIDGYPRNVEQVAALDTILQERNRVAAMCIFFALDESIARDRIKERALRDNRPDDAKPEAIDKRIRTFNEQTLPAANMYREEGRLVEVDGSRTIQAVHAEIRGIVKSILNL